MYSGGTEYLFPLKYTNESFWTLTLMELSKYNSMMFILGKGDKYSFSF